MWLLLVKIGAVLQFAVKSADGLMKGAKMIPSYKTSEWVEFNVGGKLFQTTKKTLMADPDSIFPLLVRNKRSELDLFKKLRLEHIQALLAAGKPVVAEPEEDADIDLKLAKISRASNGDIVFDRDPPYFGPVLNYLRNRKLIYDRNLCLDGVLAEAKFFEVNKLVALIEEEKKRLALPPASPKEPKNNAAIDKALD
eukprot:TRINITY_DN20085_c0_g1_i1.p3 TRINITY_DN20085_c0_g1~~TRINITY_DN20085_c0_g1_i1.p3  ORF type:complete len:196 (+),score=91.46 TRINITY_DN20085_c0_g1_i1:108-695(+)